MDACLVKQKRIIEAIEKNYWVSPTGTIFSWLRRGGGRVKMPSPLKPRDVFGYDQVALYDRFKEPPVQARVHIVVWLQFHGPYSKELEINHIDRNKKNNNLKNLELVTASENVQHRFRTGSWKQ